MNNKLCRHCGALLQHYRSGIRYCPECGGLIEKPERREIDPECFVKEFGTLAYCLPDLTIDEWRTIEGSEKSAREIYHEDECVSLKLAFAMMAIPDRNYETLFLNKGYRVVALVKNGIHTILASDVECEDDISAQSYDIEMSGYIENDRYRRAWRFRISGDVWDRFVASAVSDELPIDSKIVFACSDCIGGELECGKDDEITSFLPYSDRFVRERNDLLCVGEMLEVRYGSKNVQRQILLTRSQFYSIHRKLREEEASKWRNIKV